MSRRTSRRDYVASPVTSFLSRRVSGLFSHVSCHICRPVSGNLSRHDPRHVSCRISRHVSGHALSCVSSQLSSHVSCQIHHIHRHASGHVFGHVLCHVCRNNSGHISRRDFHLIFHHVSRRSSCHDYVASPLASRLRSRLCHDPRHVSSQTSLLIFAIPSLVTSRVSHVSLSHLSHTSLIGSPLLTAIVTPLVTSLVTSVVRHDSVTSPVLPFVVFLMSLATTLLAFRVTPLVTCSVATSRSQNVLRATAKAIQPTQSVQRARCAISKCESHHIEIDSTHPKCAALCDLKMCTAPGRERPDPPKVRRGFILQSHNVSRTTRVQFACCKCAPGHSESDSIHPKCAEGSPCDLKMRAAPQSDLTHPQ